MTPYPAPSLCWPNRPQGSDALLFVFSDGFDRGSATSRAEIIQGATDINVAIYALRFDPAQESLKHAAAVERNGKGIDLLPLTKMVVDMGAATVRKNLMQSYADFTGGVVYTHWKKHTLEEDLQRIAWILTVNISWPMFQAT